MLHAFALTPRGLLRGCEFDLKDNSIVNKEEREVNHELMLQRFGGVFSARIMPTTNRSTCQPPCVRIINGSRADLDRSI
jgi:hypothetical protein